MITKDIKFLRQQSIPASKEESLEIISLLEKELEYSNQIGNNGIGLAAPQIGILKQVAIVRIDTIKINLVNCKIVEKYDEISSEEGCLSLPGKNCQVKRYNQIIVKDNLDEPGDFCVYGLPAICVQHEMDHWYGKLIIDDVKLNIGPNMPCFCGSKLKYKKCCGKNK